MVQHLPGIPEEQGRCEGCGRPGRLAYCDACAPPDRPLGTPVPVGWTRDDFIQSAWRRNGRPIIKGNDAR